MYCTLAQLKQYLRIDATNTADDDLLNAMIAAAGARVDSFCGRMFWAGEETRRYSIAFDVFRGRMALRADLSHVVSVVNGDGEELTDDVMTFPQREPPYYELALKTKTWQAGEDGYGTIAIRGRWAFMMAAHADLIRASNVVTAQFANHIIAGSPVAIYSSADETFDGDFATTLANGESIAWAQTAADDSAPAIVLYTPPDIVSATRRLAAWLYRQKDNQSGDADRPVVLSDGALLLPSTLPQDVTQTLLPYRTLG